MRWLLLPLLLAALPAHADTWAADTLKLATWNLNWLTARPGSDPALPADVQPRQPQDFTRLARYAAFLAADVVAFEEVDGPAIAARLFPPDRYDLHLTADHVVQRVGLAIRHGIAWTANPDLAGLDVAAPDAAHRLRAGADITLDLPAGRLRILAIHLKSGCADGPLDRPGLPCTELRRQIPVLAGWIAARQADGVAFVVLGDFNRVLDAAGGQADDAMMATLRAAAPLARAEDGTADPCWGGGGFIDHILLGGDAIDWVVPASLRVLVYGETDARMKRHLSDHCPLSVRLRPAAPPRQRRPS